MLFPDNHKPYKRWSACVFLDFITMHHLYISTTFLRQRCYLPPSFRFSYAIYYLKQFLSDMRRSRTPNPSSPPSTRKSLRSGRRSGRARSSRERSPLLPPGPTSAVPLHTAGIIRSPRFVSSSSSSLSVIPNSPNVSTNPRPRRGPSSTRQPRTTLSGSLQSTYVTCSYIYTYSSSPNRTFNDLNPSEEKTLVASSNLTPVLLMTSEAAPFAMSQAFPEKDTRIPILAVEVVWSEVLLAASRLASSKQADIESFVSGLKLRAHVGLLNSKQLRSHQNRHRGKLVVHLAGQYVKFNSGAKLRSRQEVLCFVNQKGSTSSGR